MNSDSAFTIGKSHKICQDYSLASPNEPFVIVSDGCSSSPNTDVGARLITHLYANLAKEFEWVVKDDILDLADEQRNHLKLPRECLDCTLLYASVFDRNKYVLNMYGDGCAAKTRHDLTIEVVLIEYTSGAPYYLSYWLDPGRRRSYIEKFGLNKIITKFDIKPDGTIVNFSQVKNDLDMHYEEIGLTGSYKDISIMSDGINSFYKLVNTGTSLLQETIEPAVVLKELLSFKGYQGEFVQRRVQRFHKDCERMNWFHADDLSLGTIAL